LINPAFLEFLELTGARAILEVGSGMSLLTQAVAQRHPAAEVVGVEYSAQQLARAKHTLPNLRCVQGDAHHLEFEEDRFDVVYCRCLLEHVANPAQVLREMWRVTRPGGRVFVQENDTAVQRFDPPFS
jgi:ubiquinone/menaquinone biosynthesis C-methylase UbiE